MKPEIEQKSCLLCTPLVSECVCHLTKVLPYDGGDFKFEYAHEMDTVPNTQFWKVLPDYD
jgi:hypothetical protein